MHAEASSACTFISSLVRIPPPPLGRHLIPLCSCSTSPWMILRHERQSPYASEWYASEEGPKYPSSSHSPSDYLFGSHFDVGLMRRSEKAMPTCEKRRSTVAELAGQPRY
jgi:hypothetical protein